MCPICPMCPMCPMCPIGCFRKTFFWQINWQNLLIISLDVRLKESKRFFDFFWNILVSNVSNVENIGRVAQCPCGFLGCPHCCWSWTPHCCWSWGPFVHPSIVHPSIVIYFIIFWKLVLQIKYYTLDLSQTPHIIF